MCVVWRVVCAVWRVVSAYIGTYYLLAPLLHEFWLPGNSQFCYLIIWHIKITPPLKLRVLSNMHIVVYRPLSLARSVQNVIVFIPRAYELRLRFSDRLST